MTEIMQNALTDTTSVTLIWQLFWREYIVWLESFNYCFNQGGRVVKALDLSSNGRMSAWVRTPPLVIIAWQSLIMQCFIWFISNELDQARSNQMLVNEVPLWLTEFMQILRTVHHKCYFKLSISLNDNISLWNTSRTICCFWLYQGGRVVKELELSSNGQMSPRVRTPPLVITT